MTSREVGAEVKKRKEFAKVLENAACSLTINTSPLFPQNEFFICYGTFLPNLTFQKLLVRCLSAHHLAVS